MSQPQYTLTKHRGKLALTWREPGRDTPRRISTGTDEPIAAASIARRMWDALHSAKSERVRDIWAAYLHSREAAGLDLGRFNVTWKALEPFFGDMIGAKITEADCRAYHSRRHKLGKAPATITTELALLRASLYHHYGKQSGLKLWIPPTSAPREHWLNKEDVRTLVEEASSPHVKLFLILAATTGARSQSILDLTWDRVDFRSNTIDFRPAGREITNKRRVRVPMNSTSKPYLEEAHKGRLTDHVIEWDGKPVANIKKAIQRLSAKTGIKVSPHVLRHSAAVWMAQNAVPIDKIAQYLGHTDPDITFKYYAHFHPLHMKDASEATNFL